MRARRRLEPILLPAGEGQHRARVRLVDHEDVDDARPQDAEDRPGLLGLAHDRHDGVDPAQVVDGQRDQAAAVGRLDETARGVHVVAQHVPDGALAAEPGDLLPRQAPAADHGAGVVRIADADERDRRLRGHAQRVCHGLLLQQPVPDLRALHVGRCEEALGAPAAPLGEGAADVVRVRRGVDPRRSPHRADERAVEPVLRPEEARHLARVPAVAYRHHGPVAEAPLEVPRGAAGHRLALRLGVRV